MGEVFAGPGFRTCSHPGCRWPATATLGFDYSTRHAWLEDMTPRRHPSTYDLCSLHAERFKPPLHWTVSDRREIPEPIFSIDQVEMVQAADILNESFDEGSDAAIDALEIPSQELNASPDLQGMLELPGR